MKKELDGDQIFLANYADGLTDLNFPLMIEIFLKNKDAIGSFMACIPDLSLNWIESDGQNRVTGINSFSDSSLFINAGFFIFKKEIFDYINYGEELIDKPFKRLIKKKKLICYKYDGFWKAMDTFKDKIHMDDIAKRGNAPWEIWEK